MSDVKDNPVAAERSSDREFVVKRTVNGPARLVFAAWSQPELFRKWWLPKSMGMTMVSCEMDVRTGGSYRLVIGHPSAPEPMAFFGKYIEVVPDARIVWTNEEDGDAGTVTTVTFEERGDVTVVTWRDLYPSKAALDEVIATGANGAPGDEQFGQLDDVLAG